MTDQFGFAAVNLEKWIIVVRAAKLSKNDPRPLVRSVQVVPFVLFTEVHVPVPVRSFFYLSKAVESLF